MSKKHHSTGTRSRREAVRARRRAVQARRWSAIGAVLVIALIAIIAFAFKPDGGTEAAATVQGAQEISAQQAYEYYQTGDYFFLDVREQEEWDNFHIPGTTLIPLGELPDRLAEVPTDKPIVVVCNSGNRSQTGRDTLLQAGFTNVRSMEGGVTGWSDLGYPIEGTRP